MTNPFGVGIVGAGTIGRVHATAIAGLDAARVVAVAEPQESAGRALATEHDVPWHADADDLLARPDVDVVLIATPSGLHAQQTIRAAQANKHVIVEKPMATILDDVDRMIAACRDAGLALAVVFQSRFGRDAVRLKRAIEAGLLGQPVLGAAQIHWHRSDAYYEASGGWRGTWALDGGGALINQSIHTIDLLQWILGPVATVGAQTATLTHDIETEDTASAAIRFSSGAVGTIQGTTSASHDWPARLEIVGTAGRAVLEGPRLTAWHPARDVPPDDLLTPADLAATAGFAPDEPFDHAHARQFRAVFDALRAGEQPPVAGAEARNAVEIVLAIYRSARTGERVTLPLLSA